MFFPLLKEKHPTNATALAYRFSIYSQGDFQELISIILLCQPDKLNISNAVVVF